MFQLASIAKFFALALECFEAQPIFHEETTASLTVQTVAGGIVAHLDVHADLWTLEPLGACLQTALKETSL